MKKWLVLLALGTIISACGGGSSKQQQLRAGDVALPNLSKTALCSGEEKLNKDQLYVTEVLLARSGSQTNPKCVGKSSDQGATIQVHVVVNTYSGGSTREQEASSFLHKVSGQWESEDYGFNLADTSQQERADQQEASNDAAIAQAQMAEATEVVASQTQSAEQQTLSKIRIVSASIGSASLGERYYDSELPDFDLQVSLVSQLPKEYQTAYGHVEAEIRLSDGTGVKYSSDDCVFSGRASVTPGESQVNWRVCSKDDSYGKLSDAQAESLGEGASLLSLTIVSHSGVKSDPFTP